jgi:hypothetical protein
MALTHAEPVDDTANNHLRQVPRDNLEDRADNVANKAEQDGFLATKLVAEGEGKDGSAERAELQETFRGKIYVQQFCSTVCWAQRTEKQLEVMPEMLACLVSGK